MPDIELFLALRTQGRGGSTGFGPEQAWGKPSQSLSCGSRGKSKAGKGNHLGWDVGGPWARGVGPSCAGSG